MMLQLELLKKVGYEKYHNFQLVLLLSLNEDLVQVQLRLR